MSPAAAEAVVLEHLTWDLPNLSDAELAEVQAEHAYLQGHGADEMRRAIDKEFEFRQATRRAYTTGGAL